MAALTQIGIHDPVHIDVLSRRFGLRGRPMTLEAIGRRFSYTKQRIQQIESDAARVARAAGNVPPVLETAIRVVEQQLPLETQKVAPLLRRNGIRGLDCERLVKLGKFFGAAAFEVHTVLKTRMLCRRGQGKELRAVTDAAERLGWRHGLFSVDQVRKELDSPLPAHRVHDVLSSLDNYRFVEDGLIYSRRLLDKSSLMLNLRKVFSVQSTLGVDTVTDGINRARRQKQERPPVSVEALRSLFEQEIDFVLDNGSVTCNQTRQPRSVLCSSELGLLRVFRAARGRTLAFEDAVRKACDDNGLSREAAVYYLQHSPIIQKHGRGRYGLRDGPPPGNN